MLYKRKRYSEYLPLKLEDLVLLHNIPLIKYEDREVYNDKIIIRLTLIGLYREERISFTIPAFKQYAPFFSYDDYQSFAARVAKEACMEKWPLKDPFRYACFRSHNDIFNIHIEYPEKLGDNIFDWRSMHEALRVLPQIHANDKNVIFVYLYNDCLRLNINNFRSKYKKNFTGSPTEKLLKKAGVPEEVRRFICRVDSPIIERETDNMNKKSFDFIRIRISIPTKKSFPNRKEFIKNNMKYFTQTALNKIENSKRFLRYGIPVTCLSLNKASITCSSELELLFELKDELRNMEP